MQSHSNATAISETPQETSGFDVFDLPHALARSLAHMKYAQPTPIQIQAVPAVLKNKDILASAQTGTGKTGAFVIPILAKLMNDPHQNALIMAPTRELAAQILQVVRQMAHGHSAISAALLIGGESMGKQRAQVSAKPRLIIGTPGRMNDHLRSNPRMYMKTTMLVLDEADRMLDMGFAPQIKDIIETTNPQRQTLMFSATFPPNIVKFAQQYLRDPVRITIEPERTSAALIKHEELHTSEGARYGELLKQLEARTGSVIIFIKTKHGADRMAKRLLEAKLSVDVIHGGLNQRQRDRAIAGFRNGKTRIMVATDVAARGLDVPHIEHVINYDLPQVPEDYVHRIGRTGRNGKEGVALSFIMPSEMGKWRAIQRILNPNATRSENEKRPNRSANSAPGRDRPRQKSYFKPRIDAIDLEGDAPAQPRRDSRPSGNPRFEQRRDRPRDDRPRDDRPREDRQGRPWANKPARTEHGPRDEAQPDMPRSNERPRFDKPRSDKPWSNRGPRPATQGDDRRQARPRFEKSDFQKPRFDKPRGEGNFRPREDGEPNGNLRERETHDPKGIRSEDRRPQKPHGSKPFAKKPFGKKKFFGNKSRFDRKD
ncbi:MAG: DEAD/DEAH box helicase [Proteobacteria bacterium]|nr:DEAD/DEAH box helicase [Pseudomonadota bacterium]